MRYVLSLVALVLILADTEAGGHRRRGHCGPQQCGGGQSCGDQGCGGQAPTPGYYQPSAGMVPAAMTGSSGALDEVNQARARRGLPPFQADPLLEQGAQEAARRRASRLCAGHLPESDFNCLPPGAHASAAGCAAWTPDWGWGSCCSYDRYAFAGAAVAMGADGRRYMHLFVR